MVQARGASLTRPNVLFVLADDMGWGTPIRFLIWIHFITFFGYIRVGLVKASRSPPRAPFYLCTPTGTPTHPPSHSCTSLLPLSLSLSLARSGDVGFNKIYLQPPAGGGKFTPNPPRTPHLDAWATGPGSMLFDRFCEEPDTLPCNPL